MDTDELLVLARQLLESMCLAEGPRNADDQIGMAQAYAAMAVANELKQLREISAILEAVLRLKVDYGV